MNPSTDSHESGQMEQVFLYAVQALPRPEMASVEAHLSGCVDCRQRLESLQPVVGALADWPTDVVRPPSSLWGRLAERIAGETGQAPHQPPARDWSEPDWKEVAPGIWCKLLATDAERNRVSMLVRLAPGVAYPSHTHVGVEELHLLDGELWIEDRKLLPGDYNRGEPGSTDLRVWSETGCTCVLIASPGDLLR